MRTVLTVIVHDDDGSRGVVPALPPPIHSGGLESDSHAILLLGWPVLTAHRRWSSPACSPLLVRFPFCGVLSIDGCSQGKEGRTKDVDPGWQKRLRRQARAIFGNK